MKKMIGNSNIFNTYDIIAACNGKIHSIAFSPDSKIMAVGTQYQGIKLFDVISREELKSLVGHFDRVTSVCFHTNVNKLIIASASDDYTIKLWDVTSGDEIRTFSGEGNLLRGVAFFPTAAFSPDGKTLAGLLKGQIIELWNIEENKKTLCIRADYQGGNVLAFSPDGRFLAGPAVNSEANVCVRLWEVKTGEKVTDFVGHGNSVYSVAFSLDNKTLVTGGYDAKVKIWNVETSKELKTFSTGRGIVEAVAISLNNSIIVAGCYYPSTLKGFIKVWDFETGKLLKTLNSPFGGTLTTLALSPEGTILAAAFGAYIILWDLD